MSSDTKPKPPPYWKEIGHPLSEVITTIVNLIDREKRDELEARATGMRTWLLANIRVARSVYEVIEVLARERDKVSLSLDASVALPPLARVILESVFAVVYVFDDPATRLPDFWKGTWAKIAEEHDRTVADYGSDTRFQPHIKKLAEQRDGWRDDLVKQGTPLSAAQLAEPKSVRWPNPGKMPKRCVDQWRKDTLAYLDGRFYGPLSVASHLSGTGLLSQAGHLLPQASDEQRRYYFSKQFAIAGIVVLALVSVFAIDVVPEPSLARRVVKLWTNPNLPDRAHEAYDACFRTKLEATAAA